MVSVTGLQPLLTTARWRWLECYHLSMPSPRPAACAGPACVQHAYILFASPDTQFLCTHVCFFFVITHTSTVLSILISNLINKYNTLTLTPNMPCMLLVDVIVQHPVCHKGRMLLYSNLQTKLMAKWKWAQFLKGRSTLCKTMLPPSTLGWRALATNLLLLTGPRPDVSNKISKMERAYKCQWYTFWPLSRLPFRCFSSPINSHGNRPSLHSIRCTVCLFISPRGFLQSIMWPHHQYDTWKGC